MWVEPGGAWPQTSVWLLLAVGFIVLHLRTVEAHDFQQKCFLVFGFYYECSRRTEAPFLSFFLYISANSQNPNMYCNMNYLISRPDKDHSMRCIVNV